MIEGPDRRSKALGDRADGHGGRAAFGGYRQRGVEKIGGPKGSGAGVKMSKDVSDLINSDSEIKKAYEGIPLMPTYHPAFLLRTPSAKREVWADLQEVMRELDRLGIARPKK